MGKTIIVGYGLAGFALATQLTQRKQEFCIIDQPQWSASRVAAGVCNPTVLKRYSLVWNADLFYPYAQRFYKHVTDQKLDKNINYSSSIARIFPNTEEHSVWEKAASSFTLEPYLDKQIAKEMSSSVISKNGYGIVKNVIRIDIPKLLDEFKSQLKDEQFIEEEFDYSALNLNSKKIDYKKYVADRVVFCEGFQMQKNPFFKHFALIGNKGEMLVIKAPKLNVSHIIKSRIFIVPLEMDYFWVGATFEWEDKTLNPSSEAKKWLKKYLKKIILVPYEIVCHSARIRPTVIDRKPLLGRHHKHQNLFVFNGLGTRGSLMAPLLSEWLFKFIHENIPLPEEIDISRFKKIK